MPRKKRYIQKEAILINKFARKIKLQNKDLKSINFNCKARNFMNCEFVLDKIHYRLEALVLGENGKPGNLFARIYQGRKHINYKQKDIKRVYGLLLYTQELKKFIERLEITSIDWKIFGRQVNAKVIWLYNEELDTIEHFDWELLFALI